MLAEMSHRWRNCEIWRTKDKACAVDAVVYRAGNPVGIVEIRTRDADWKVIESFEPKGTYLITAEKLNKGLEWAADAVVPYYLVVVSWPSRRARLWTLDAGMDFECQKTWTKETINGGLALRPNAFVPFSLAEDFGVIR